MAFAGVISARLIFLGNNLTSTLAFTGDYRVLRVSKRPTEILGADHPTHRFSTRPSTIEAGLRRPHCPAAAATTSSSAQTSLNQTTHPPLRVRLRQARTTSEWTGTLMPVRTILTSKLSDILHNGAFRFHPSGTLRSEWSSLNSTNLKPKCA